MFVQQPSYNTFQPGYYTMPQHHGYYAMPTHTKQAPQIVLPAQPSVHPSMPSPTLMPSYIIQDTGSPVGTLSSPPRGLEQMSDCGSNSSFSLSLNSQVPSPNQAFSIPTPPPVVSPQNMPTVFPAHLTYHNVVCSPGPVMYDAAALQSAWTIPQQSFQPQQNVQWQPVWVQSPVNSQPQSHTSIPPGFAPLIEPTPSEPSPPPKTFFKEEETCQLATQGPRKSSSRVRCKACSASGSRMSASKKIPTEHIIEATREIPEVMAELPEFFGEPQLNFQEFVHYAPIFRTPAMNGDVLYFKIPRTTKERELNIPRRLCELFNRTFGPDDAPDSKAFDRISPHNHLCAARCAIRNAIVKSMQETIFTGCRNMDEGNHIFSLIFRFAGVSMVKTITTNLPQVFTAVVGFDEEKKETELKEAQAFECTGVVSLFNYHLFRRRIKEIS